MGLVLRESPTIRPGFPNFQNFTRYSFLGADYGLFLLPVLFSAGKHFILSFRVIHPHAP